MTRVEPQWVQHMREALEEFVQDVRQTLPERPSVADIERTLSWIERHVLSRTAPTGPARLSGLSALEAQRQLMRDLMQSVVDDHAPPPPQDLENAMEVSGKAVSAGQSSMGESTRSVTVPKASRKPKS